MPIEPVDPSKKPGGDGSEKYTPKEKRGPSEFDKALEKEKAERARAEASKMAEEHRAKVKAESPRTYTERLQDMGRLPSGGSSGNMGISKLSSRDITKNNKAGGIVRSSASKRADGCAIKGKTKGRMI
jgi:hypothetical protein